MNDRLPYQITYRLSEPDLPSEAQAADQRGRRHKSLQEFHERVKWLPG